MFLLDIDNWMYLFVIYEVAFSNGWVVVDWAVFRLDDKSHSFKFADAAIHYIGPAEEGEDEGEPEEQDGKYYYLFYGNESDMNDGAYRALRFGSREEMMKHGEYLEDKGWHHVFGGATDCKRCEKMPLYRYNRKKPTKPVILGPGERLWYIVDNEWGFGENELVRMHEEKELGR